MGGKAPAPQFYVKDWSSDFKLQSCSHSTKGIWMDILCHMIWEKTGGVIEDEYENLKRTLRATTSDFDFFLVEAERHKFCDIFRTCRNLSQESPEIIRIINRRIFREEKKRESDRLRKQKQRCVQDDSEQIPKKVTRHSPTPSPSPPPKSIAKADKSVSSDNKHWSNKIGDSLNKIRPIRDKIFAIQEDNFNIDQFIQVKIKKRGHPKGILDALNGLYRKAISDEPPDSWFAYAEKIFKTQSQNHTYEDGQEAHEFYKTMEISGEMKKFLAGLVKGVE